MTPKAVMFTVDVTAPHENAPGAADSQATGEALIRYRNWLVLFLRFLFFTYPFSHKSNRRISPLTFFFTITVYPLWCWVIELLFVY